MWPGIVIGTLVIESLCVLFRFGFGLESTRDTASTIGVLTLGLRVHHGYLGLLLLLILPWLRGPRLRHWVLVLAWSLILSDLCHHFLVLWPILGDPEFHIWYPPGQ